MIKDLRPALRTLLTTAPAVVAIVGARIFPHAIPQGVRAPAVVYNRIPGVGGDYTMQGPVSLASSVLQVDCWAGDPDTACVLARAVRERLEGFAGDVVVDDGSPSESVSIQGVFVDANGDDFDGLAKLYRERVDYRFAWVER